MREEIIIINGLLQNNDNYAEDFHYFIEDNVLIVIVLLPGTNPKSLIIEIQGTTLTLVLEVMKDAFPIMKSKKIRIVGELPFRVHEKTYSVESKNGLYKLYLSREI